MEKSLLNKERLRFLSTLRLDVQFQAQEALIRQNMKKNLFREPTEFKEGQLILCRIISLDQLNYRSAYYKAVPHWTLPHCVFRVLPNKKSAIVQCLLTQKTRQIHIQDAQFISPPKGEVQRREWFDLINTEAQSMFDPDVCRETVEKFFDEVQQPQVQESMSSRSKRYRVA